MCRLLIAVLVLGAWSSSATAGFRVLEAHDETSVRLEFTLGPFALVPVDNPHGAFHEVETSAIGSTDEPGAPALPVFSTLIGLPPDALPSVRVLESTVETVPGVRPVPAVRRLADASESESTTLPVGPEIDDAIYDRARNYPLTLTTLGQTGRLRNQAVVPLIVTPVRARGGGAPALLVATRLVIEVRFNRTASEDRRWIPVTGTDGSDRVYERSVLNASQAERWRHRPAVAIPPALRAGLSRPRSQAVKIRIRSNGLVRVDHSTLVEVGWKGSVPLADLELATRGYDASRLPDESPFTRTPIATEVFDEDGDGRFGDGDWLIFYAQEARTQRGWEPPRDRYSWENVYWLTTGAGAGTPMDHRDGAPTGEPATEPVTYEHWERHEENRYYYWYSVDGDDTANLRQAVDHLWFTSPLYTPTEQQIGQRLPFTVWDADPGTPFGFRAEWQAIDVSTNQTFTPSIFVGSGSTPGTPLPGAPFSVNGDRAYTYDSGGLNLGPEYIDAGAGSRPHEFVTELMSGRLAVNWFEVGYRRRYVADDSGKLTFTNDGTSDRIRYTVSGFASADVFTIDLSDPDRPVRITGAEVTPDDGFQIRFEDMVTGDRRYLSQDLAAIRVLDETEMELDRPSRLADLSGGNPGLRADHLIVVPDAFVEALAPLIAWRERQGRRLEVARMSDVYDEFGGGLFTPEAIREYVRYAYRLRPGAGGVQPTSLLLVGDGSEDYWGVTEHGGVPVADPNWVPPYIVLGSVSDNPRKPLEPSDHWFIANPDGDDTGNPYLSSMLLGRLPVGSVAEVETVVEKIVQYERQVHVSVPDLSWRQRALMIADDCYSGSFGAGGGAYRGRTAERAFAENTRHAIDTLRAAGFTEIEPDTFFLSHYLDTIPDLGRDGTCTDVPDCGWTCTRRHVRNVRDLDTELVDRLNQGHLFVTYDGHANRSLLSHEYVFMGTGFVAADPGQTPDGWVRDVERLTNGDRLPVWFMFAVHTGEFADRSEGREERGDALAERLVLHPDGGAIGAFGSVGFEWLSNNRPMHLSIYSAWFSPTDNIPPQRINRLGTIVRDAKNLVAATGVPSYENMVNSYTTFGDPMLGIEMTSPGFRVWQDAGERPWEAGVPPLDGSTSIQAVDPTTDRALFAATLKDHAPIAPASIRVGKRGVWGTTWAPDSLLQVTPGEPDRNGGVRHYTLRCEIELEPRDYELVFQATTGDGRVIERAISSRVEVTFAETLPGGEVRPIVEGGTYTGHPLCATVRTPVGLPSHGLAVLVDGQPQDLVVTTGPGMEPGGERSFSWRLEVGSFENPGRIETVALSWETPQGPETRSVRLARASFRVTRVFAFPNPFPLETGLFYDATQASRSTRVTIYTLRGRAIRSIEGGASTAGINQIRWDGRDDDGDQVANGVYLYRMEIEGPEGVSVHRGKVARVAAGE